MLSGKTVLLGVCGGIAAYKAVDIASRLRKINADVYTVMTDNAKEFVTPLTFQSITNNLVLNNMFDETKNWDIAHISLATIADIVIVAPATANIIGKIANGIADDFLTTIIMATKAKVVFAPAMNSNMYENQIVQENIRRLKCLGFLFIESDVGRMACGTYGVGRLAEPEVIVKNITRILSHIDVDYSGKNILITAGPTREYIDPVRYISNCSSGKMGYALAKRGFLRGAKVKVITGPVSIDEIKGIEFKSINTAIEMRDEVLKNLNEYDIIIMVAAVADYRCETKATNKIKKSGDKLSLTLIKIPDIAKEVGKIKGSKYLVGFCAETENLVENAIKKIKSKNLDMIVANDVTKQGAGFEVDTNIVTIIKRDGLKTELPIMSKDEVADRI